METGDDPYQILGVSQTATTDEIKKAYRKLAVKHHPDKQTTDAGRAAAQHKFARIANAYELIGDEDNRKHYDQQQEETGGGFDGNATYDVPQGGSSTTYTSKPPRGRKYPPVHFHDPYEVFKRAFKEDFGVAYPGAKYDYIKKSEAPRHMLTNGPNNNTAIVPSDAKPEKKKGGFMGRFRKGKDETNEKQLIVHPSNNQKKPQTKGQSSAITKHAGSQLVEYEGDDYIDNRPTSMKETTRKIRHPGGQVETITEVVITRPDGSVERMRKTDNANISKENWGNRKQLPMLTNGPTQPQKRLTNGTQPKKLTNGQPQKLLTNGSSTPPKRGLFGRRK